MLKAFNWFMDAWIGATAGVLFAIVVNVLTFSYQIGSNIESMIETGAIFGFAAGLASMVAIAILRLSPLRAFNYIILGALCGLGIFALNIHFGVNAGWSIFGALVASTFGVVASLGSFASRRSRVRK